MNPQYLVNLKTVILTVIQLLLSQLWKMKKKTFLRYSVNHTRYYNINNNKIAEYFKIKLSKNWLWKYFHTYSNRQVFRFYHIFIICAHRFPSMVMCAQSDFWTDGQGDCNMSGGIIYYRYECVTSLTTILQVCHGSQFNWWRKSDWAHITMLGNLCAQMINIW
jgi:hypothetical protein